MPSPLTARDWVERAYLAMSGLLPADFRGRFAPEMLEFFRARRATARALGMQLTDQAPSYVVDL